MTIGTRTQRATRDWCEQSDFVGQLGDPNRPRKSPALFFEFEEIGGNEELGYKRPGDLHDNYAKFYWDVVSPYIQEALRYLRVTQDGKAVDRQFVCECFRRGTWMSYLQDL